MSSDYLLQGLGYNPDQSAKRLGDGLFEQKLIQQAVVARTGQRFIDGQTSDEAVFKYLMNNAIASKDALNLSLGVTLTAQQVAALTHDIVWLEEHEVNGEKVLVPVLYLANANNRLAANGALIQGSDVTLIAGKDLNNAGTLRASQNLEATAKNDLVSSGLVEAGERLNLLATNNLTNKAGGIIAGRDVTLKATNGDVVNERTVTSHDSSVEFSSLPEGSWVLLILHGNAHIHFQHAAVLIVGRVHRVTLKPRTLVVGQSALRHPLSTQLSPCRRNFTGRAFEMRDGVATTGQISDGKRVFGFEIGRHFDAGVVAAVLRWCGARVVVAYAVTYVVEEVVFDHPWGDGFAPEGADFRAVGAGVAQVGDAGWR